MRTSCSSVTPQGRATAHHTYIYILKHSKNRKKNARTSRWATIIVDSNNNNEDGDGDGDGSTANFGTPWQLCAGSVVDMREDHLLLVGIKKDLFRDNTL